MMRDQVFVIPTCAPPASAPGNEPQKPAPDLGGYGSLASAPDEAVADAALGHHAVGTRKPESEVLRRYSWVCGIRPGDNAHLGASWLTFRSRSGLVAVQVRDGERIVQRVRAKAIDWKAAKPAPEPQKWTRIDGLGRADAKAKLVFNAAQEREVKRLVDERLKEAGL